VNKQHTAGHCNRHSILHSSRYVFPNDLCLDGTAVPCTAGLLPASIFNCSD
jgi:hypothetical protein